MIILIGGDIIALQHMFIEQGVPCVNGFELLGEISLQAETSEEELNKNQMLDVFDVMRSEQSMEILVEFLGNRLAPQLGTKTYKNLFFSEDYLDKTCYHLTDHECFVDCGAFNGDTIRNYIKNIGSFEHIYSFEMDKG